MSTSMTDFDSWLLLAVLLAATASAAGGGVMFRPGNWYRSLAKPAWTPPDKLFPVAWTVLYLIMAIAAWRVALAGGPHAQLALALWAWQLVLNALWSPVFFGQHRIRAGAVTLALLLVAVAATLIAFARVEPVAGLLLLPYLLWIGYAAALNLAILRLNGGRSAAGL